MNVSTKIQFNLFSFEKVPRKGHLGKFMREKRSCWCAGYNFIDVGVTNVRTFLNNSQRSKPQK